MKKQILFSLGLALGMGLMASASQASSMVETVVQCASVPSFGTGNEVQIFEATVRKYTATGEYALIVGLVAGSGSSGDGWGSSSSGDGWGSGSSNNGGWGGSQSRGRWGSHEIIVLSQEYVKFEPPSLGQPARFKGANSILEVDVDRGEGALALGISQTKKKMFCPL